MAARSSDRLLVARMGIWYVNWAFKGKRHFVSTRVKVGEIGDKVRAREWRDRYCDQVRRAHDRDPEGLWRELKRALEAVAPEVQRELRDRWIRELQDGAAVRRLAWDEVWTAWERSPLRGRAGGETLDNYAVAFRRWVAWAAARGLAGLQDVREGNAAEYAADLWADGVAPGTYNAHIAVLRSVWRVVGMIVGVSGNPWEAVGRQEKRREGRRALTADEMRRVLVAAGDLRDLFALGAYTGMRLGDAVGLRWRDVDLDGSMIEITPSKTARTGRKVRIPIHPHLAMILAGRRRAGGEWVFAELEGYQGNRDAVSKRVQAVFEAAGIVTREAPGEHRKRAIVRVGYHSLRHSFVSLCAAAGVPQSAIMDMVGHGSPAMTAAYTHADDALRRRAIDALPDMAGGAA
jgi:integrase